MIKKRILTPFIIILLSLLILFTAFGIAIGFKGKRQVAVAETTDSSSLFDGVLQLVCDKGESLIKSKLPSALADYLCVRIFDYFGIDRTDKYTKNLQEINNRLNEIQTDLQTIIQNQAKQTSQNTISDLFNSVDVFSVKMHPVYAGYNDLLLKETDGTYSAEKAKTEEKAFYENNLKNLLFGTRGSTGELYVQLDMLLKQIVTPNKIDNKTLMEHYVISYEHLWAFDTQSFAPKKEFLAYLSTTALEGLIVYVFQYSYEYGIAESDNNSTEKAKLNAEWTIVSQDVEKAFGYLKAEIDAVNTAEEESDDTNTAFHYATGIKVSKNLFTGRLLTQVNYPRRSDSSNYFTYEALSYDHNGWPIYSEFALDNRSFVNSVVNDFKNYIKNYKKDNSFTFVNFLQICGFKCDDWSKISGIYRGQSYNHSGWKLSTEFWKFYVEYTDIYGTNQSLCYGDIKQKVLGTPDARGFAGCDNYYAAFVAPNGILVGNYTQIYSDYGNIADSIHQSLLGYPKNYRESASSNTLGKVW